jgi:hypothetical protein
VLCSPWSITKEEGDSVKIFSREFDGQYNVNNDLLSLYLSMHYSDHTNHTNIQTTLNASVVGNRVKSLDTFSTGFDQSSLTGLDGLSLKMHCSSTFLCNSTFLRVLLNSSQEIFKLDTHLVGCYHHDIWSVEHAQHAHAISSQYICCPRSFAMTHRRHSW